MSQRTTPSWFLSLFFAFVPVYYSGWLRTQGASGCAWKGCEIPLAFYGCSGSTTVLMRDLPCSIDFR